MSDHTDPMTAQVVWLIARIVERYTHEYDQAAARQDLTTIQAKVLSCLDEPLPMHRIAERLGSERSNVTGIIDRLQARGLVQRRQDSRDRRIKNIVLTDAGRELAQGFRASLNFAAEPLVALEPAEREQLRDLLHRIVDLDQPTDIP
jgi:DNA-binding MarR family transcriptional regulator